MTELQKNTIRKKVSSLNKGLISKKVVFTVFEGGQSQIEVFLPHTIIFQAMCNNTVEARQELQSARFKEAINEK